MTRHPAVSTFFFFNDTATTEIYTLSLHDALPIYRNVGQEDKGLRLRPRSRRLLRQAVRHGGLDRKSTRLNSSHQIISYAVFCLKKKRAQWRARPTARPASSHHWCLNESTPHATLP